MSNWKITYDGNSSVSDFLFKIKTLSARSRCTEDHLLSNFHVLLKGKAERWYWRYSKQTRNITFESLCNAITKEFGHLESDHDIVLKMTLRKQHYKESYDDFHTEMVSMNSRLRNPMPEQTLIDITKRNLSPNLKFLLFNSETRSLDDLRDTARKAENVLKDSKYINPNIVPNRNISELETPREDTSDLDCTGPQI